MTQGNDGNFYGTASQGGSHNDGTVFDVTPAGVLTVLHSFSGSDGSDPMAALIQGSDGNFYGTTNSGGSSGDGTVFQLTLGGTLTILHSFSGSGDDGANPQAALTQGSDGNLYGTTYQGGSNGYGTVFEIPTGGLVTTLHSFSGFLSDGSSDDGFYPAAGLVQGSDGNFYGTTSGGDPRNSADSGTVFGMTPAGTLTTLYAFSGRNGGNPRSALTQGSDGNFYGTTAGSGFDGDATVFQITPGGTLTTLYDFSSVSGDGSGEEPFTVLVQGTSGNFYGTTNSLSTSDAGTAFQITPGGALTSLYSFPANNSYPAYINSGLIQGSDGNFYGTTNSGGTYGNGTIYRLNIAAYVGTLVFNAASYTVNENAGSATITVERTGGSDGGGIIHLTQG